MKELERFVSKKDGVVSVSELARFMDIDEQVVRRWARENDLRRLGSTFVFSLETAKAFEEDLLAEDDDDLDDDDDEDADGEDADGEDADGGDADGEDADGEDADGEEDDDEEDDDDE